MGAIGGRLLPPVSCHPGVGPAATLPTLGAAGPAPRMASAATGERLLGERRVDVGG